MVSPTPTAGGIKPLNVSASGVSTLLGVSRSMVHKLDVADLLPRPIRIGRRKLWRVAELQAWNDAGCPRRDDWDRLGSKWGRQR